MPQDQDPDPTCQGSLYTNPPPHHQGLMSQNPRTASRSSHNLKSTSTWELRTVGPPGVQAWSPRLLSRHVEPQFPHSTPATHPGDSGWDTSGTTHHHRHTGWREACQGDQEDRDPPSPNRAGGWVPKVGAGFGSRASSTVSRSPSSTRCASKDPGERHRLPRTEAQLGHGATALHPRPH